ncbi:MAG: hypothetical protein AAF809_06690 [Bacteroidota bacterium]
MRLALLLSALAISALPASAQTLIGTWQEPNIGVTVAFHSDGSYTAQGAQATGGTYQVEGTIITLYEQTGNVWQYQVTGINDTQFAAVDAQGNGYQFQRVAAASPGPAGAGGTALAQKNGLALTEGDVELAVQLLNFMIGQPVTARERAEVQQFALSEFDKDPQAYLADVADLRGAMTQILSLSDPVAVGGMRQALVGAFHNLAEGMDETPLFVTILRRHVQVVGQDAANNLTLTSWDVAGMVNLTALTAEANGAPMSEQAKAEFRAYLIEAFPAMPLEEKQQLAAAGITWDLVAANLAAFSAQQQQALQAQMQQQAQAAYGAQPIPDWSSQLQGQDVDPATWAQLSQMSQGMHASMMNGIEAMGGSSDYWEVREVDPATGLPRY